MIEYNDSSIRVLSDVEHIRTVPYMYISASSPSLQMFEEIFSNALDEAINGFAKNITVTIDYADSQITIEDDGRGLPQGINKELQIPTIEVIYGKLNAGGKYDRDTYAVSGGLHGVGSCVVNALSEYLEVRTRRGGSASKYRFERGCKVHSISDIPIKDKTAHGTNVKYRIDTDLELFSEDPLSKHESDIIQRMYLIASLYPSIHLTYNGEVIISGKLDSLLPTDDKYLLPHPIIIDKKNLKVVLNWTDSLRGGSYSSYCNLITTKSGGDHIYGIEDGLQDIFKPEILLGLNMVVSAVYPGVKFEGQSKDRAKSKEMREILRCTVKDHMRVLLREDPELESTLVRMVNSKIEALNAKKAKKVVQKKDRRTSYLMALSSEGFADCTTKDRSKAELTICEGLSAAGSLKQARDIVTQAVLPLRGKFINAYNCDLKSLLSNREASTLLTSLDTGILEEANVSKCRYNKVIIFTDADQDGYHIACLLIGFFSKVLPDLLREGMLYLALPPLYGTTINGRFIPLYTEEEKDYYLKKGAYVQRYKGLGEMMPEHLRVSSLDPETRRLIQLKVNEDSFETIERVMSGEASHRRDLLVEMGVFRD